MITAMKRAEAFNQGVARYYTGKACARGHTVERYTSSGNCVECAKAAAGQFLTQKRKAMAANFDARRHELLPPLHVHVDDHEAVYVLIDYLNQARGRPPCPRPNVVPVAPPVDPRTPWEREYDLLIRVHRRDDLVRRLLASRHPETHSPGWRQFDDGLDTPEKAAIREATAYRGGAKPDYLP